MRSDAQIEASRINGAKSRGPVTERGKRRSIKNNIRHGILASTVVLDTEDPNTFAELVAGLKTKYAPQTADEHVLIEKMAVAYWRQMRLWGIERELYHGEASDPDSLMTPAGRAAAAFRRLNPDGGTHELLGRYEARYDRQYFRALRQLNLPREPKPPSRELLCV
jgi:hypothetical protein